MTYADRTNDLPWACLLYRMKGFTREEISARFGISRRELHELLKPLWFNAPRRIELTAANGAYNWQKKTARRRGIAWEFTFESWWDVWCSSGKWVERGGHRADGYVMARHGDVGPYAPWNVRITTVHENCTEAVDNRRPGKLTDDQVRMIRRTAGTISAGTLSKQLGVHQVTVSNARRGATYKRRGHI